jgi:hypothetical protein
MDESVAGVAGSAAGGELELAAIEAAAVEISPEVLAGEFD